MSPEGHEHNRETADQTSGIRPFPYNVVVDDRLKDREVRRLREKIATEYDSNPDGCIYAIKKLFRMKSTETPQAVDILEWIRERVEQHKQVMKTTAQGYMNNDKN